MADQKTYTTQTVFKNGQMYMQTLLDGTVVAEAPIEVQQQATKPTPPPVAEPVNQVQATTTAPAAESTVVDKQAEPKKVSSKLKKGLAIGGGVIGGVLLYALGGKRGKAEGAAEGYSAGYQDGKDSVTVEEPTTNNWEAPE